MIFHFIELSIQRSIMKNKHIWLFIVIILLSYGCSVQSVIKKSVETIYKASVDERSIRHIIIDKKLSSLIMAELIKDDMTNLLNVTAECFFGYPFVVGECNNLEEAQRIIEIAQRITEKQPIPFLMKKGGDDDCNPALNLKISTEVKARLLADKKIFATNVVVKSIQCQAVLLGVLGSKEAILAAIEHSEKVDGVKKVHSFLVSTDTGRSWDSVFKAMGKDASDSTDNAITSSDGRKTDSGESPESKKIDTNNESPAHVLEPDESSSTHDSGNETIQPLPVE